MAPSTAVRIRLYYPATLPALMSIEHLMPRIFLRRLWIQPPRPRPGTPRPVVTASIRIQDRRNT